MSHALPPTALTASERRILRLKHITRGMSNQTHLITRTGGAFLLPVQLKPEFRNLLGWSGDLDAPNFLAMTGTIRVFDYYRPNAIIRPGTFI